jgi:hypothetical protein
MTKKKGKEEKKDSKITRVKEKPRERAKKCKIQYCVVYD